MKIDVNLDLGDFTPVAHTIAVEHEWNFPPDTRLMAIGVADDFQPVLTVKVFDLGLGSADRCACGGCGRVVGINAMFIVYTVEDFPREARYLYPFCLRDSITAACEGLDL